MYLKRTSDHLNTMRCALWWGFSRSLGIRLHFGMDTLVSTQNDQIVKIQMTPRWVRLHCNLVEYIHSLMENASQSWKLDKGDLKRPTRTVEVRWLLAIWYAGPIGRIISAVELTATASPKTLQWCYLVDVMKCKLFALVLPFPLLAHSYWFRHHFLQEVLPS